MWAPLDLSLAPGVLAVLTGDNGSGKSTLLRLSAGLLRPSHGSRECHGLALYLRAGGGLRSAQTVEDAVRTTAAVAGRPSPAPSLLELVGLSALRRRRVGSLSAGERVRAGLAASLAAGPALLCLDEPTAALDEAGLAVLQRVIASACADGCAVLIATHQPQSLLPGADAHLRIAAGRVSVA